MTYLNPPAVLLRELEPAAPEIKTNLDLLNYAVELRSLVEELNADNSLHSQIERAPDGETKSPVSAVR